MNFPIFLGDKIFQKASVLLVELNKNLLLYVFSGHFTSATNPHLTHAYAPVVTSCKNVYFLLAPRWKKTII